MKGPAPSTSGRSRGWYWFRATVAIGGVAFLLFQVSLERVEGALANTRPAFIGLGLVAAAISRLGAAYRLRGFTRAVGYVEPLSTIFRINLGALFYSLFIPGGTVTAGAVRVLRLGELGVPTADAAAAVFRDRLDATVFLILTGLAFLALSSEGAAGIPTASLVILACIVLGSLALFVESPLARSLDDWIDQVQLRFVGHRVRRAWEALRRTGTLAVRRHLGLALSSVFIHVAGTTAYYFLSRGMGLELSFLQIGWIRTVVILLTMIPVSLGGIGVREAAFVTILGTLGIDSESSLVLSLLVFTTTILVFGLLGGALEGVAPVSEAGGRNGRERVV